MRIKWLFVVGVLALLGLAAAYLARNFVGLGPVPLRSAFAGRLPNVPGSDRDLFRFFYATNRKPTEDAFEGRGNQLGDKISKGTFDVRISPYIPIKPFIWFDTEQMQWAGRQEIPGEQFDTQLREAVQASPHKSLLVIVWGFRDWFQSAALKSGYTAYALDINTPVLLFDWPGNQGEGFRGYTAAQEVSTQSAPDLGRVLAEVLKNSGAEKVWVMGSSLGCQTICDALKWVKTQPDLLPEKSKLSQVIFSAPDVSADAFDEKFAEIIQALSQHFCSYVSSNDQALLMSEWLNGVRRLGRKADIMVPPENRVTQYEFEEALELLELQAKGARNITVVDATPINFTRNLHHFFTDSPAFFDDLYQRLLRPDDIISRPLHSVRTRANTTYWILWNDIPL